GRSAGRRSGWPTSRLDLDGWTNDGGDSYHGDRMYISIPAFFAGPNPSASGIRSETVSPAWAMYGTLIPHFRFVASKRPPSSCAGATTIARWPVPVRVGLGFFQVTTTSSPSLARTWAFWNADWESSGKDSDRHFDSGFSADAFRLSACSPARP